MNVLHVIRDLSVATGGPATALRGLAAAQARSGLDVAILTTDHGGEAEPRPEGVAVEVVPAWPGSWGFAAGFRGAVERRIEKADVVHLHMVWDYPVWAAARAAVRHGKPFVLRPCGQLDRWSMAQKERKKRLYLKLFGAQLRAASAVHFTTEGERDSARPAIGSTASFVAPIGVAESAYRDLPPKTAFASRFPALAGRRLVLFLGRLHPKKQPDLLIDAFAQIAQDIEDAHLVIAGPGEANYVASLEARVRSRNLGGRTTFTGPLAGAAVTEAYRAAETFALPSLQENFGIAIVEAMAAGCPVLVGDRLDLAGAIEAAQAGLVLPATREHFAEALRTLLTDPALAARMGAKGRELVLQRYTWGPAAEQVIDTYREIVGRRPAALRHVREPVSG